MSFKKFSEEVAPRVHATVLTTLDGCPEEVDVKKLEADVMAELRDNWFRIRTHKVAVRRAYAERVAGTMSRGLLRRRRDDGFKRYYPTALGLVETNVARILRDWRSDVPDVVSTAMLNLWIYWDSIPLDPEKRRAYVITTARNVSVSHLRSLNRRVRRLEKLGQEPVCVDAQDGRTSEQREVDAVAAVLASLSGEGHMFAAPPSALVDFVEGRVRKVVEWIDARAAWDRRFPRERMLQTLVMGLQTVQQLEISKKIHCSASMVCHYIEFLVELVEDDDPPPDKPLRHRSKASKEKGAQKPRKSPKTPKPPKAPTSSLEVFMLTIELIQECFDACEREDVLKDLGLEVHDTIPGEFVRLESSVATREAAPPVRRAWADNEPLELEECELLEEWFEEYLRHSFRGFVDAETDPSWCGAFVSIEDHGGQCDSSDDFGEWRRSALMSALGYAMILVTQACGDDGRPPTDETSPTCVPTAVWAPDGSSVGTPDPGSLDENCHDWGYERHPLGAFVREEDFVEHFLPVPGTQMDSRNAGRDTFDDVVADLDVLLDAPVDHVCDGLFGRSEKLRAIFDAQLGAALQLANVKIDLPPNSMVDRTWKPVPVTVCAIVTDSDRIDVLLDGFGMIGVELTTWGELVKLAESAEIDARGWTMLPGWHHDPGRGEWRKHGDFIPSKGEPGQYVATTYTDGDLSWITLGLMLDKPRCFGVRVVDVATGSTVQPVESHAKVPGVVPIGCDESRPRLNWDFCGCQLMDTCAVTQGRCGADASEGCSSAAVGFVFMCDERSIVWLLGDSEFLPELEGVDTAWLVDKATVIDFMADGDCVSEHHCLGVFVAKAPTGDRPIENVSCATACYVGVTERGRPRDPPFGTNRDECVPLLGGSPEGISASRKALYLAWSGVRQDDIVRWRGLDALGALAMIRPMVSWEAATFRAIGGGEWNRVMFAESRVIHLSGHGFASTDDDDQTSSVMVKFLHLPDIRMDYDHSRPAIADGEPWSQLRGVPQGWPWWDSRLRVRWRERTVVARSRRTRATRAWGRWGRPGRSARAEQPLYGPPGRRLSPASSRVSDTICVHVERAVPEVRS